MNARDDHGRFVSEADRLHIRDQAANMASRLGIAKGLEQKIDLLADLSDLHVERDGTVSGLRERVMAVKAEHPAWFAGPLDNVPDGQIVDALRGRQREIDETAMRSRLQALKDERIDWNTVPDDRLDETLRTKILEIRTP